jgi:hypothetical protein
MGWGEHTVAPGRKEQWLPWAWPHDGHQSGGKFDAKDQKKLADLYRDHGLKMLKDHAQFTDGTNGVESGVMMMLERMETGRWKVFANCSDWFEEFRNYHREEGVIVKEMDDTLCASRYAAMMLRFGITRPALARTDAMTTVGDPHVGY